MTSSHGDTSSAHYSRPAASDDQNWASFSDAERGITEIDEGFRGDRLEFPDIEFRSRRCQRVRRDRQDRRERNVTASRELPLRAFGHRPEWERLAGLTSQGF
jgi:hypothetical protein